MAEHGDNPAFTERHAPRPIAAAGAGARRLAHGLRQAARLRRPAAGVAELSTRLAQRLATPGRAGRWAGVIVQRRQSEALRLPAFEPPLITRLRRFEPGWADTVPSPLGGSLPHAAGQLQRMRAHSLAQPASAGHDERSAPAASRLAYVQVARALPAARPAGRARRDGAALARDLAGRMVAPASLLQRLLGQPLVRAGRPQQPSGLAQATTPIARRLGLPVAGGQSAARSEATARQVHDTGAADDPAGDRGEAWRHGLAGVQPEPALGAAGLTLVRPTAWGEPAALAGRGWDGPAVTAHSPIPWTARLARAALPLALVARAPFESRVAPSAGAIIRRVSTRPTPGADTRGMAHAAIDASDRAPLPLVGGRAFRDAPTSIARRLIGATDPRASDAAYRLVGANSSISRSHRQADTNASRQAGSFYRTGVAPQAPAYRSGLAADAPPLVRRWASGTEPRRPAQGRRPASAPIPGRPASAPSHGRPTESAGAARLFAGQTASQPGFGLIRRSLAAIAPSTAYMARALASHVHLALEAPAALRPAEASAGALPMVLARAWQPALGARPSSVPLGRADRLDQPPRVGHRQASAALGPRRQLALAPASHAGLDTVQRLRLAASAWPPVIAAGARLQRRAQPLLIARAPFVAGRLTQRQPGAHRPAGEQDDRSGPIITARAEPPAQGRAPVGPWLGRLAAYPAARESAPASDGGLVRRLRAAGGPGPAAARSGAPAWPLAGGAAGRLQRFLVRRAFQGALARAQGAAPSEAHELAGRLQRLSWPALAAGHFDAGLGVAQAAPAADLALAGWPVLQRDVEALVQRLVERASRPDATERPGQAQPAPAPNDPPDTLVTARRAAGGVAAQPDTRTAEASPTALDLLQPIARAAAPRRDAGPQTAVAARVQRVEADAQAADTEALELEELARQVYARLRRRLLAEAERLGR